MDPDQLVVPRLGRNLNGGLRLAFLRKISLEQFRIDFAQVVTLFIVNALVALISDYLIVAPPKGFNVYGLTGYATHQLLFIIAVLLFATWLGRRSRGDRGLSRRPSSPLPFHVLFSLTLTQVQVHPSPSL